MNFSKYGFSTKAIMAGQTPDSSTGAVIPPLYLTSTYIQIEPGVNQGFEYSRQENPTKWAYEKCLEELENGKAGFSFGSGLAAISTALDVLDKDSHVIAPDDLYGGTYRMFEKVKARTSGLTVTYVDLNNTELLEKSIRPNTKMIWVETPTNPLLQIFDLQKIAEIAKKHNIITVCDNTFATPYLQRPIDLGFDMVMHSTTKYINGHSDVIGGALVVGDNPKLIEDVKFLQNAIGSVSSPFDCFLANRGVKTLAIRMEKHCSNAQHVAEWLVSQPKVCKVYYPGLTTHPDYQLAKTQMRNFGGMLSFELDATKEDVFKFMKACKVINLAVSLGGVESLISYPAVMTHGSIPEEIRKAKGITDGLVRLSVGIEDVDDLIMDLEQALTVLEA